MNEKRSELEVSLDELYDMRKKRERMARHDAEEAMKIKHEFRLVALMFSNGFGDISVPLSEDETIEWDASAKRILYHKGDMSQFIEAIDITNLLKLRPYLKMLVNKARENFMLNS